MSNFAPKIDTLFNLTLNHICQFMTHDYLGKVLKLLHPKISLQILWKILHVNNDNNEYTYNYTTPNNGNHSHEICSILRGRKLAHMEFEDVPITRNLSIVIEAFAIIQQTKFVNRFNFTDHFDLELLFKLLEVTNARGQLCTIFQICVQLKGFDYPKNLAEEWIQIKINDKSQDIIYCYIEQGLKLGIFLGDSGWLNECAQVLSHTYKIITTLWLCSDQNLMLLKSIQCLTKWLLALSKIHRFNETKRVLKCMFHILNLLERIKERSLCIANAYVAISQYYYLTIEYNKAWSWAVKAVHELRDTSNNSLKVSVISHAIKICSVLNKFGTANKLINQLSTYKKEINQYIYIDMLLNEAVYLLKTEQPLSCREYYFYALDSARNLFGYFNFQCIIILFEYVYARYTFLNSVQDYQDAIQSAYQAVFILRKLKIPSNNLLFVNIVQLKALIVDKTMTFIIKRQTSHPFYEILGDNIPIIKETKLWKKKFLNKADLIHSRVLTLTIDVVGIKSMLTAKSFSQLGNIYQMQEKYKKSERMFLKAVEIKESLLDKNSVEIALSYAELGQLNLIRSKKLRSAEQFLLKSSKIFMTNYGLQYKEFLYNLEGLKTVYLKQRKIDNLNKYTAQLESSTTLRKIWLHEVTTAVDYDLLKHGLSIENFKSILIDNSCDKK